MTKKNCICICKLCIYNDWLVINKSLYKKNIYLSLHLFVCFIVTEYLLNKPPPFPPPKKSIPNTNLHLYAAPVIFHIVLPPFPLCFLNFFLPFSLSLSPSNFVIIAPFFPIFPKWCLKISVIFSLSLILFH